MGNLNTKPIDNLTYEEIKELENTFMLFDEDGSGSISADELGQVLRALGQDPSPEELEAMLEAVDADGSGTIERDEFINLMAKRSKGYEKEVKMAFKVFNKGGFITADELRELFETIGEKVTNKQLRKMIKVADADGKGKVNYRQFSTMMKAILESKDQAKEAQKNPPPADSSNPSKP